MTIAVVQMCMWRHVWESLPWSQGVIDGALRCLTFGGHITKISVLLLMSLSKPPLLLNSKLAFFCMHWPNTSWFVQPTYYWYKMNRYDVPAVCFLCWIFIMNNPIKSPLSVEVTANSSFCWASRGSTLRTVSVPLALKRTEEMSQLQEQHNSQSTAVSLIYTEKWNALAATKSLLKETWGSRCKYLAVLDFCLCHRRRRVSWGWRKKKKMKPNVSFE